MAERLRLAGADGVLDEIAANAPAIAPGPASAPVDDVVSIGSKVQIDEYAYDPDGVLARAIERAETSIDKVHRIGAETATGYGERLNIGTITEVQGRYQFDELSPRLLQVNNSTAPTPDFTLLHEIGHWLDHASIGGGPPDFASASSDLLAEWREAVKKSKAAKKFRRLKKDGLVKVNHPKLGVVDRTVDDAYIKYLTSHEELFARSYAQYIAEETGDPVLLEQLASELGDPEIGYPEQWETNDFKKIKKAFNNLFEALGWK